MQCIVWFSTHLLLEVRWGPCLLDIAFKAMYNLRPSQVSRPNCFQKQVGRGTWLRQRTSLTLFVRYNICKKSYTTWFSGQKFYSVKVRNLWHCSLRMDGGHFSQSACSLAWLLWCFEIIKEELFRQHQVTYPFLQPVRVYRHPDKIVCNGLPPF